METEKDHMKIIQAHLNENGSVLALVESERVGDLVGLTEVIFSPGDGGFDAALAAAEKQGEN